jgi:hypothetical protein
MKKFILIIIGVFLISTCAISQYNVNKTKYDYRTYFHQVGDPYNPAVAGITSYLIPGLGQILSGETGRGLAFLGGYVVCSTIYLAGTLSIYFKNGPTESGLGLIAGGALLLLSYQIWTIVDAIRVAKVNNLAFRDKNKSSCIIKVQPYIGSINYYSSTKPVTGLSFKFSF